MNLKFKTQDFQTAVVAAVVDLFKGQRLYFVLETKR
jgi:hypothetical protein